MTNLTDHQIGYLAGIIDGEGSIGLYRTKNRTYMKPEVQIINTDVEALKIIQGWIGGNIFPRKIRIAGRKQLFTLGVHSQNAILELLRIVEPFLIIKKPQAQLLIVWCALRQCGGSPINEDDLFVSIKGINKRGDN